MLGLDKFRITFAGVLTSACVQTIMMKKATINKLSLII